MVVTGMLAIQGPYLRREAEENAGLVEEAPGGWGFSLDPLVFFLLFLFPRRERY